jgi:hypothetical protein
MGGSCEELTFRFCERRVFSEALCSMELLEVEDQMILQCNE